MRREDDARVGSLAMERLARHRRIFLWHADDLFPNGMSKSHARAVDNPAPELPAWHDCPRRDPVGYARIAKHRAS